MPHYARTNSNIAKFEHVCISLTSIKVKLDFLSGFIKAVDACYNQYRHRNKLKFDHSHKRLRADLMCNDALHTDWQLDDNKMSDRVSYVKVTREARSIRETVCIKSSGSFRPLSNRKL